MIEETEIAELSFGVKKSKVEETQKITAQLSVGTNSSRQDNANGAVIVA